MKTSKLFSTAVMALSLSALVACSSDEPAGVKGDVAEKDQTLYFKVAIQDVNAPGSRVANDNKYFEDGVGTENDINNLRFLFFDAAGTQIYQTNVEDVELNNAPDGIAPNVGKLAVATVKVKVGQGTNMPAYVLCFANPVNWSGFDDNTKMDDFRNIKRGKFVTHIDDGDKFAMNNSVYYGTDPISGANDVKMTGAPIQKGQLFTSVEAAKNASGGSVVDIYIERYAAKVKLTMPQATDIGTVRYGGYTLTFVPEKWSITADAAEMYAVKRFANSADEESVVPTLADVNKTLGKWTIWNDAPNHRSYWACSPAFYATQFPSVSDNIIDVATEGTGAGEVVDPYALKYYSYTDIMGNGNDINDNVRYALENTMGKDAFTSANPKAAAPSVIIVGNYKLDGVPENTSFYLYEANGLYFKDNAPEGKKTIMEYMLEHQYVLATDESGENILRTSENYPVAVQHPGKAERDMTGALLSEELVTLQLTAPATNLYYRPQGSATWKAVATPQDVLYVNRQLAGQLNYAHAYTNGKAYFIIPVQHLGYTENEAGKPESIVNQGTEDEKFVLDWSKVRVGDFGLVRNHVYSLNVTAITGTASGINNLENPIVTPMETNNYWIKYSLNVLNWRIVPSQNVIL